MFYGGTCCMILHLKGSRSGLVGALFSTHLAVL
jgi:hypothetical protein